MIDIIKAEFLKSKRTTTNKFVVMTPLILLLLGALLGAGQFGAYNWWYVMFLPGMLAIISSQVISREKNLSYKGILLYPLDKASVWLGKILYVSILFILTSLIFMVGIEFLGIINEPTIPLKANMFGTLILILTFLFNIPISMFLTTQFNMFVAILFNVCMTIIGVVSHTFGSDTILRFLPYRISSGLMMPILHIQPNGLPVPENSQLLNGDMIFRDTLISIVLFIVLTILTAIWFRRKEVN